MMFLIGAVKKY